MPGFEQTERTYGVHRAEYAGLLISFIGGPVAREALSPNTMAAILSDNLLGEAAEALAISPTPGEQVEGGNN